jgi:hypothetical protein
MSLRSAILAPLLLMAATSIGAAQDQPVDPGAPEEPRWTEFQSAERGFAIAFPGTPKVTNTPVAGQNPLIQHEFQVSVGSDTVYSIVVFEYPAGKAPSPPDNDYYLKVVNAYAKGSDTRLRKKGRATIAEREGYEAMAEDARGKLNHLVDIVPDGDRIYMLATAGPRGHASSDDAVRFRDSFRLLSGGSQTQSAATPPAQ